jgi:predicted dithiol-disulfide oxidoreductase (DUF899 family)
MRCSNRQWLVERKKLLAHEKEHTDEYDRVNAERRRLPMVKIEKDYSFDGPNGKVSFNDLFEGRRQLVVYHFMFNPSWEKGCPGCTSWVDSLADLSPLAKCDGVSSFGSDFNYDFHVTLDPKISPMEYNYRTEVV